MIKVRICSEHKYDIILGKGKKPLKSAYELASLPYGETDEHVKPDKHAYESELGYKMGSYNANFMKN